MGRVNQETLSKLRDFLDSLPAEVKGKCALCNETLTHIVKKAEVETGAGTATVTRALADNINEGAADGDRVSGKQLQFRARYHEGKDKVGNSNNTPAPHQPDTTNQCGETPRPSYEQLRKYSQSNGAIYFADLAILQLERIMDDDQTAKEALANVIEWCHAKLNKLEV